MVVAANKVITIQDKPTTAIICALESKLGNSFNSEMIASSIYSEMKPIHTGSIKPLMLFLKYICANKINNMTMAIGFSKVLVLNQ